MRCASCTTEATTVLTGGGPSSFRVEANSQNHWSSSSPVRMWAGCPCRRRAGRRACSRRLSSCVLPRRRPHVRGNVDLRGLVEVELHFAALVTSPLRPRDSPSCLRRPYRLVTEDPDPGTSPVIGSPSFAVPGWEATTKAEAVALETHALFSVIRRRESRDNDGELPSLAGVRRP